MPRFDWTNRVNRTDLYSGFLILIAVGILVVSIHGFSLTTNGLEYWILVSNIAVLVGVALEFWEIKEDATPEPGHFKYSPLGNRLSGSYDAGTIPSTAKIRAGYGWRILTVGLFCEVVLTFFLIPSQRNDEALTINREMQLQRSIERLEIQVQELEKGKR